MKRLTAKALSVLLCSSFLLSFASCGTQSDTDDAPNSENAEPEQDTQENEAEQDPSGSDDVSQADDDRTEQ